jgi:hypothetical protein
MVVARMTMVFILIVYSVAVVANDNWSTLRLSVVDTQTGKQTPARVEIIDASDNGRVATDSLRYGGDCDMSDTGAGFITRESALEGFKDRLENPYTGTLQFYSTGESSTQVSPGIVRVRVFKGPEYKVSKHEIEVPRGETVELTVSMDRWIDMPSKGWYSGDDHLHIQRPHADLNPLIMAMMQAEDIHVANLLQMGKVNNFDIAPQYQFGKAGQFYDGNYVLAAGQENPRTHYLGHTITLGLDRTIFDAERYLIYRRIWEQSVALGGVNGFAHAYAENGTDLSPLDGLGVILPHNLLHFMEVLQFNRSGFEAWYDVLNLGFAVTPTAGTDYPCAQQVLPGHERFFAHVDGEFTYRKWLDAVRGGRTFVTTGPILEFDVNGQKTGATVDVGENGVVLVKGKVSFQTDRDDVFFLELLENGKLVHRVSRVDGESSIEFEYEHEAAVSSWLALRALGTELWEAGFVEQHPYHFTDFSAPTSVAHTGAVYLSVKGSPAIGEDDSGKQLARGWLARLNDLEYTLKESNIPELARKLQNPNFDAVPEKAIRSSREGLLREIRIAQSYFRDKID